MYAHALPATSPPHRRRRRFVGAVLATGGLLLAGCSGEASSTGASSPAGASGTDDSVAAHTPTDLKHPCDVVTSSVASRLLGEPVTTKKIKNKLATRTLDCSYIPAKQDVDAPFLEIASTPDPTPLAPMIGMYIGVDRLQHHPVDIPGADEAAVILDPGDTPSLTLFAKQGFVTHTFVLGMDDLDRAERVARQLAARLVAGNL
jgi:hypothetical protein